MNESIWLLTGTAASIGFIHTLIGPDHYLPFIMMSQAQKWSQRKTMLITFLCGIGHVLSSVLLGFAGVLFGVALQKLEFIEGFRGELAAWVLIVFGLVYGIWGLKVAMRGRTHVHEHAHDDGTVHRHEHTHLLSGAAHRRSHHKTMTTWALFTIFVLGPCEPLIPILMYPAAQQSGFGVLLVASVFGIVTIATMMGMVWLLSSGLARVPLKSMERYTHAIAGGIIASSGLAIQVFGL
ncbi:MAG: sulfite exporter TauE/SafE family protein [Bacteroidota bacterium]|nr:sulfite exporter TauE/SafE family protein [Bacteroidota bacterium]